MADTKITGLTALTTPAGEDLFTIVDDPSGTPVTKKITLTNLFDNIPDATILTGGTLDIADVTDGNVPYMSASGFADSPISVDGTNIAIGSTSAGNNKLRIDYDPEDDSGAYGIYLDYNPNTTTTMAQTGLGIFASVEPSVASGEKNTSAIRAIQGNAVGAAGLVGDITELTGLFFTFGNLSGTGTVDNAYGVRVKARHASGTVTNSYGIHVGAPTTGGTVTNEWAIYAEDDAPSYFAGDIEIGSGILALTETTTPTAVAGEARIYSKSDNNLYYQDGAGTEHQLATV